MSNHDAIMDLISDDECREIMRHYKEWEGSPKTVYMNHVSSALHDYFSKSPTDKRAKEYLRDILKTCLAGLYEE